MEQIRFLARVGDLTAEKATVAPRPERISPRL